MNVAKLLVIGGGGREHALAWKLAQSAEVREILVAPGNAGTSTEPKCRNVAIAAEDVEALLELAKREAVDFTVVGPEAPLALGIVDRFTAEGLRIFGPTRAAAQLESSKAYTKDFLARHRIPTAGYAVFTEVEPALSYIKARGAPIVIKADGLAAGKGVVVAVSVDEACDAVRGMLGGDWLGQAGARVVIEDFLSGEEASFIIVASGRDYVAMATSQDHKRIGDGDTGPNTGGMGAYSPAPVVTPEVDARIRREVIEPTLVGMLADGVPFTGFLYAGLMITPDGAPSVIEFNVRFGDPETQPVLFRLQSDLFGLLQAAVDGKLAAMPDPAWNPEPALGVVMAAGGYPGSYRKGVAIQGLERAHATNVKVFHAGTAESDEGVVTAGGRVLCVCATGASVEAARAEAYAAVAQIGWDGVQYRRDIGWRAIEREKEHG
ncbi:phosphoribosylamine--glycine ligase [Algiphilus sp. W345]|uniref:Phosphoribosylamine--glycine ligase n=1 Tax=Banduia mediterranea TaxID=3075609 RepID=A0ABU2WP35_9GAMM|nr:phosphoribosylamine--glycine ligase [Algiphilus sp. W345]MDT0499111.1 phosphoribosylamine--glycine ligase [Algiphilus sp. W345]